MKVNNGVTPLMGARRGPMPVRLGFQAKLPMAPQAPLKKSSLGAFDLDRLPDSVLWVTGGAAALWAGGILPSPADSVIRALGIASVGYGIYYLFKGDGSEKVVTKETNVLSSVGAFESITGSFIKPRMYEQVPVQLFGTYNFWDIPVEFEVRNPSDEEVSFNLIVTQREVAATRVGIDVPREHTYDAIPVKLAPRSHELKRFDIDTLNWVGGLWINLIVRKVGPGAPAGGAKISEVTFFA